MVNRGLLNIIICGSFRSQSAVCTDAVVIPASKAACSALPTIDRKPLPNHRFGFDGSQAAYKLATRRRGTDSVDQIGLMKLHVGSVIAHTE